MSLPDTSGMIVQISVHESSVDKVRPGQNAKIIVDAFPDRTFYGKVLKVAPLPDPQMGWLNPDLKTYNTEVSIDGSHDCLKPGMSAKAEILVEQLNNVLIAPVQVVANRGGKKVCYCMTGRGPEQREVETGVFNDTFVQITNGLKAGEEVLLNPPRIIEAAPAASSEKPQKPFRKKAKEPDTGKSTQNERAPSGPPADRK